MYIRQVYIHRVYVFTIPEDRKFVKGWLGERKAQEFFEQSKRDIDAVDNLEMQLSMQGINPATETN